MLEETPNNILYFLTLSLNRTIYFVTIVNNIHDQYQYQNQKVKKLWKIGDQTTNDV